MAAPTGEQILAILVNLYADQMGVNIRYTIKDDSEQPERKTSKEETAYACASSK